MRTSVDAIQAGYEDAQRRAMAQRDAEMARARARYATSSQQGSAEYQIHTANMAKVTAPKAPRPANRKLDALWSCGYDARYAPGVHLDNVVECSINHKLADGRPVTLASSP